MSRRSDIAELQQRAPRMQAQIEAFDKQLTQQVERARGIPGSEGVLTDEDWLEAVAGLHHLKCKAKPLLTELCEASLEKLTDINPVLVRLLYGAWWKKMIAVTGVWNKLSRQYGVELGQLKQEALTKPPKEVSLAELRCKCPNPHDEPDKYCKLREAADKLGLETDTLRKYRTLGRKSDDGMFGIDIRERVWAKVGTPHSQTRYLRSTLQ